MFNLHNVIVTTIVTRYSSIQINIRCPSTLLYQYLLMYRILEFSKGHIIISYVLCRLQVLGTASLLIKLNTIYIYTTHVHCKYSRYIIHTYICIIRYVFQIGKKGKLLREPLLAKKIAVNIQFFSLLFHACKQHYSLCFDYYQSKQLLEIVCQNKGFCS